MFKVPKLLLLLLVCYSRPLTAIVTILPDHGPECFLPQLLSISNIPNIRRDCLAALSLVPRTGLEVDPHDMVKQSHNPGNKKLFSLRISGKDAYRINKDKISLPATFFSGDCFVQVHLYGSDGSKITALFQHMYLWPDVHKQVTSIIDDCFVPEVEPIFRGPTYEPKRIGSSGTNIQVRGEQISYWFEIYTDLYIRRNSTYPCSEEEIWDFCQGFNVYTATGQINDRRRKTPVKRPPPTAHTKPAH
jgi:hypothetical protein